MNARGRIAVALALSIVAHLLLFTLTPRLEAPRQRLSSRAGSMIVNLVAAPPPPRATAPSQSIAKPAARPPPPPPAKRIITARPKTPRAAPPIAVPEEPRAEPPSAPPAPPPDMLAMLNARRERRRAAQGAREGTPTPAPVQDEGAAALERNLETLKGDDRTGGIFQILDKGGYTAEYAFNGWRPDTHRRWREVIEVRVKPGEDIDRGIVRSMIALIRTHYDGDFLWESRRLGKVVTLSARHEDNAALEEFLLREFFGTPLIHRGPAPR